MVSLRKLLIAGPLLEKINFPTLQVTLVANQYLRYTWGSFLRREKRNVRWSESYK